MAAQAPQLHAQPPGLQHTLGVRQLAPEFNVVTVGFGGRLIPGNRDAAGACPAIGRHTRIMAQMRVAEAARRRAGPQRSRQRQPSVPFGRQATSGRRAHAFSGDDGRAGRPSRRIRGQQARDRSVECRRDLRANHRRRRDDSVFVALQHTSERRTWHWKLAGGHLVEDEPERKEVRSRAGGTDPNTSSIGNGPLPMCAGPPRGRRRTAGPPGCPRATR